VTRAITIILLSIAAVACNGDAATPTSPTVVTVTTETFASRLDVGGSRFYSFTVTSGGSVSAELASVTAASTGAVMGTILELGLGVPAGTGCAVSITRDVTAALTTQLLTSFQPGIHCVRVADVGDMTVPIRFAVRFAHP
jgi:hypothetical protein